MSTVDVIIGLAIATALAGYLLAALIAPERW